MVTEPQWGWGMDLCEVSLTLRITDSLKLEYGKWGLNFTFTVLLGPNCQVSSTDNLPKDRLYTLSHKRITSPIVSLPSPWLPNLILPLRRRPFLQEFST